MSHRPQFRWVPGFRLRTAAGAVLFAAALLGLPLTAGAQGPGPMTTAFQQDEVKMMYLLQLAAFVDWPAPPAPTADQPLVIGIIDPDPFDGGLEKLAEGRTRAGRTLQIRHIREVEDLAGCLIVFVPRDTGPRWMRPLRALSHSAVLTVGETPGFAAESGVVGFFLDGDRLRLEINPEAAERAGLRLSSRLLRIARLVHAAEPGDNPPR